ncbi:hypothetical protein FB451DRAFT_1396625 [Mycena latifolia]|nr:hypothetical protein FB451DRAFT_1396625 [Mycena latifolia]
MSSTCPPSSRSSVNELRVPVRTVSRRHAALWSEEPAFTVDTHSARGTYFNGNKFVRGRTLTNAEVLIDGDILRVGATDERAAIRGITAELRIMGIARWNKDRSVCTR